MVGMIAEEIRVLKVKKARLFSDIEMLSEVNDSLYLQFVKITAKIMKLEKELLRTVKNPLHED